MEEVQTDSVIPEIANPETEVHAAPEPVQEAPKPVEGQQENFRRLRQKNKELEDKLRLQEEMMGRLMSSNQPAPTVELDEFDKIDDSEFIPKGKVKQLVSKEASRIAREIAREEAKAHAEQQRKSQFIVHLKQQFADFEDVVNLDTLALLEEKDPELAGTIADLKDPYKIGLQSYKYIKAMGLKENVPEARRIKEVEKKIEQNAKTVQTPQAYDKRPMAQAFRMTDAEKSKIYEEMMGYASQAM